MGFTSGTLDPNSSGSSGAPCSGTFEHQSDTLATISAAGYFDHEFDKLRRVGVLRVFASDGIADYLVDVDAVERTVTLTAFQQFFSAWSLGLRDGANPSSGQLERNNLALEAMAASGVVWRVEAGKTYAFSRGARFDDYSGIVCDGWCTFLMKTGTGQFDTTQNVGGTNYTSTRRTLFHTASASDTGGGKVNNVFLGIEIELEANAAIRTSRAANFYGAVGLKADLRVRGFKENQGGVVCVRSCQNSWVKVEGFALNVNTASLASMQVTVLEVDDGIVDAPITSGCFLHAIGHDWAFGATALAQYGPQTDILNVMSADRLAGVIYHGGNRIIAESRGTNGAGNVLDIWGSGNDCDVLWDDAASIAVKVTYGASRNTIRAKGNGTGLSAVNITVVGSHPTRFYPPVENTVTVDCVDVGRRYADYFAGHGQSMHAGVQIEGDLAAALDGKPSGNVVTGRVEGSASVMGYAVSQVVSGYNEVKVKSGTFATKFAIITVNAASVYPNIERTGRTRTRIAAHCAANVSTASGAKIPFTTERIDANGAYTPATPQTILDNPGNYLVSGVVHAPTLANGRTLILAVTHGGNTRNIAQRQNLSGGGLDVYLPFSTVILNTAAGATVDLVVATDDASAVTIGGDASAPFRTHLDIVELGQYYPTE